MNELVSILPFLISVRTGIGMFSLGVDKDDVQNENNREDDGIDLAGLFVFTEYRKAEIKIPTYDDENHVNDCEHDHSMAMARTTTNNPTQQYVSFELMLSPQASTDYDLTGQILWPVSMLLSYYLTSSSGRKVIVADPKQQLHPKHIVELGAGGTGLPSLIAAHFGARVVVTDGNGDVVLDQLQQNIDLFCHANTITSTKCNTTRTSISTSTTTSDVTTVVPIIPCQLVWGDKAHVQNVLKIMGGQVDVVLAADVVQWPDSVPALLNTIKALLWHSQSKEPTLLLGIVNRAANIYGPFFQLAAELGFMSIRVEPNEFLHGGIVPECCSEYGGRVTEVFRVILTDRSKEPELTERLNPQT